MKLVFYWDGLEETYEGETWKECCEECVSQEENWDIELTKIMMESQTGNMEDNIHITKISKKCSS